MGLVVLDGKEAGSGCLAGLVESCPSGESGMVGELWGDERWRGGVSGAPIEDEGGVGEEKWSGVRLGDDGWATSSDRGIFWMRRRLLLL